MAETGIFITFEGSEGCGKSTQIRHVVDALCHNGREVVLLREPGGTVIGEAIRHLLQHDEDAAGMTPEAELLLFAASRAQLVREVIRPALERGAIVLCDRFVDSTTVYQGVARALCKRDVVALNQFAVGETWPDLTLLLDLDAAEGRRRAAGRNGPADRMEREGAEFYEAVRRGYLELAAENPQRFVLLDAGGAEEAIAASVKEVIGGRFHGLF